MNKFGISTLLLAVLPWVSGSVFAAGDLETEFTNKGTIANTRHNLTQTPRDNLPGKTISAFMMDQTRNQYGEVCVYCHTPHGANTEASVQNAPLWNRSYVATTYETYDQLGTTSLTTGSVSQPGTNSLTCLSCHDGLVAIDSIINMPGTGPGRYDKGREINGSSSTLNSWHNPSDMQSQHSKLAPGVDTCMSCHATGSGNSAATDFDSFYIGTDLKDDHPVGVTFPTSNSDDFNQPGKTKGASLYFDNNDNNRMEPAEVRTYGGKVECASCHDPHGVPRGATPGIQGNRETDAFNKTFLRVQNDGSALCMTCHIK